SLVAAENVGHRSGLANRLVSAERDPRESKLSHGQSGLWFMQKLAPASAAYHLTGAVLICGQLDTAAFRATFDRLVDRHASLRATFYESAQGPVQLTHERMDGYFHETEASDWETDELNEQLAAEAARPYD